MRAGDDLRVRAKCREMGIKGHAQFARRFGRRVTDLAPEKALAILAGEPRGEPTANFPDRYARLYRAQPSRAEIDAAKDEGNRRIMAGHRDYFKRKDEADGVVAGNGDGVPGGCDGSGGRDRPVFGDTERDAGGPRPGGRFW